MAEAITNTSPMVYLYRIGVLDWLPKLFEEVWIPQPVIEELREGTRRGYDVPDPTGWDWLKTKAANAVPSEWLSLDLGPGEIAVIALALEHPSCVVLLDDLRAREIAKAAGLTVWGTLRVLLEAKSRGLTERIEPWVGRLADTGMWISDDTRDRILALASERRTR
jgi:predicted nucleic acid-binding protein